MNLKYAALLFILLISQPLLAKRTICSITINSANEIDAFGKYLSKGQYKPDAFPDLDKPEVRYNSDEYEIIELTKLGDRDDWFKNSCKSRYACDVLIISGHFAGYFFGDSGFTLTTDELEKRSCLPEEDSDSCEGILKSPKEVFLFGCNTLDSGGAEAQGRTRESYREALSHYDMTDQQIEETLAFIYDGLGDKFQTRMQRIFNKAANIHGFGDKAPLGNKIGPWLDEILGKIPNYEDRLQSVEALERVNLLQKSLGLQEDLELYNKQDDPMWLLNEKGGDKYKNYKNCMGSNYLGESQDKRKKLCELYTAPTLAQQTDLMAKMLNTDDDEVFATYLPTVMSFIRDHELDYLDNNYEYRNLKSLMGQVSNTQKNTVILNHLNSMAKRMEKSISMSANILHVKKVLGFINEKTFQEEGTSLVKRLLKDSLANNQSSLCHLYKDFKIRPAISLKDLSTVDLTKPSEAEVLSCLNVIDPMVTIKAVKAMDKAKNLKTKKLLLETYKDLPGMDNEIVNIALSFKAGSLKNLANEIILNKSTIKDQKDQAVMDLVNNKQIITMYRYLDKNPGVNPEVAKKLIHPSLGLSNITSRLRIAYAYANKEDENYMKSFYDRLDFAYSQNYFPDIIIQDHIQNEDYNNSFKNHLINFLTTPGKQPYTYEHLYSLKKVKLSEVDAKKLMTFASSIQDKTLVGAIREALKEQVGLISNRDVQSFVKSGAKLSTYCYTFVEKNIEKFSCIDPPPFLYKLSDE